MKQYIKITLSTLLCLSLLSSCSDLLEIEPEEVLLSDNYLGDDELDARSALFGVLAQMQDLYGQYMVLGEMRADLVDVNDNTIADIRSICNLTYDEDNPYIDPTNLFSIINNCNFAIAGIDTEAYDNRLLDDYASILRIRTWAQLQILIYYGKLPYIDKPIVSDSDFDDEYKLMGFDEALNQLIINLTEIANVENVSDYESDSGFTIYNMIPDNDILLGDLYLWKGEYENSAISYKRFLDNQFDGGPKYLLNSFLVTTTESNGEYFENNNWGDMFLTTSTSETINYIGYNEFYKQPNNEHSTILGQFTASQSILVKWREQSKGFEGVPYETGDNRAEGSFGSLISGYENYGFTGDQFIIKNQLAFLLYRYYRAAKVYLRYAEAINYAGYPEHALVVVNGIFNNPDVLPENSIIFEEEQEDFLKFEMEDYFTVENDIPTGGGLKGIRGRAGMAPVNFVNAATLTDSIQQAGDLILEEAALELAFEGNRWEDLVRYSKRGGSDYIVNAIGNKFETSTSGNAGLADAIKTKLRDENNWFLPLTIPSNFVETEAEN